MSRAWGRLIRRWSARAIQDARTDAYLHGLREGRAERPMTCGLPAAQHCGHSYLYDPGQ